jgi:hypothetical protein
MAIGLDASGELRPATRDEMEAFIDGLVEPALEKMRERMERLLEGFNQPEMRQLPPLQVEGEVKRS